ncbi:MAG TPA: hypothetical protein VLM80_02730 [Anaerolineales bacterium]|nr:hypothetical protein [Anaerolineales bacterium]
MATDDTGHVSFRVLTHLLGGTNTQVTILGTQMSLIGLGSLATAYTVTLFLLFVYVWQFRYQQPASWFTNLLLAADVLSLAFMDRVANQRLTTVEANWSGWKIKNRCRGGQDDCLWLSQCPIRKRCGILGSPH